MAKYLACGNIMSDQIRYEDGTVSEWHIGGPALYALSGMRIWTKECELVSQVGEDYRETYGKWLDDNGLSHDSLRVEMEECTKIYLNYRRNTNAYTYEVGRSIEYLGYLKTHAKDIEEAMTSDVRGIYMANHTDKTVWKNLLKVKEEYGFAMMWELEYNDLYTREEKLERLNLILPYVEMWSLNEEEAKDLFGMESEEGLIRHLQTLPVEMTFYRVGARGSFVITGERVIFAPSIIPQTTAVDPTGCGNCSTGAAMIGWLETHDAEMTAWMANIAAGFNAQQYGPVPVITDEIMDLAASIRAERKNWNGNV